METELKRNAETLNKYIQPHDPFLQTKYEMFSDYIKKEKQHESKHVSN